MRSPPRGFTLIELMAVVGIIGILAAVSLPAYQDYTIRARVAEGLELAAPLQQAVVAYHDRWGVLPRDNDAAGLPPPASLRGAYVESMEVAGGAVHVRYAAGLGAGLEATRTLVLRPTRARTATALPWLWLCNRQAVPAGMDAAGRLDEATLLPDKYLPNRCRSA